MEAIESIKQEAKRPNPPFPNAMSGSTSARSSKSIFNSASPSVTMSNQPMFKRLLLTFFLVKIQ